MCRELVDARDRRRAHDEGPAIPEQYWNWIAASCKRGDPSLYGRFDLRYDGKGPAKLLEYNADTPTAVFETARVPMAMAGSSDRATDRSEATPTNTIRCTSA